MSATQQRLSKSRFVAGVQCPKLLWWTVNEPGAEELQPDVVLRDLFDQGTLVGVRARSEWSNGLLIVGDYRDPERIPRTAAAIAAGTPAIFEACFDQDGVFCAVDVLERDGDGWVLIEVKSSSEVKDYHIPDVAVQVHVARRSGLDIRRAEVMHLNRDYRHPGEGPLFVRTDVTLKVEQELLRVPARIAEQLAVLAGPLPSCDVGAHCFFRGDCAFHDRCWPDDTDHISNLWNVGPKKTVEWMAEGVHTMSAIPEGAKLNWKQQRQLRAQRDNELIVEPGLADAMKPALDAQRLGFLDFETVSRALPPWNGLGPWRNTAAQFSYHERGADGAMRHVDYLAEGPADPGDPPDDPREPLARLMLEATKDADRIVVYTSFEATQIKELAGHLPALRDELMALREKLWDLNPVVAENVYHPDFRGSFSLKEILTPLVPDLSYNDLVIVDGKRASVEIARLLFVSGAIRKDERERVRHDLLEYCKRDTFATVRLVARLAQLAGSAWLVRQ
jgi:hypothetical protein